MKIDMYHNCNFSIALLEHFILWIKVFETQPKSLIEKRTYYTLKERFES